MCAQSVSSLRVLRAPWAASFMALAGALALAAAVLPAELVAVVAVPFMAASLAAAGCLFFRRSRRLAPKERRAWRLVGAGLLIACLGLVAYAAVWLIAGDLAAFGPIDLFWLVGYAGVILGIASLPHTAGNRWHRVRLLIDGTIGALAAGTLLWAFALRNVTRDLSDAGVWARLVGTAYVALDAAVLVVLMMVVIKRSTYRFDRRLVLFGLGAIAQGFADFGFLRSGLGHSFNEAQPIYWLHIVAVGMFVATALNVGVRPRQREYADRTSSPPWAIVVPYGLSLVLVILLMVRFSMAETSSGDQGLLHAVVLVAVLTITRQAVTIQEGRRSLQEQRSTLASSISHELKTPLTSIVGFLELLDSGAIDSTEERQDLISVVNGQAGYLARVVADLMLLAADGDNPMELDIEPIPVDELAWRSVNSGEIDPTAVRVDADRTAVAFVDNGRIQHALSSLLDNAVRYGGNNIELVARTDQSALVLEVHDDGPGVPSKYELVIWERFERGPNHLNATVPGSGIGLAITRKIAAAHGGSAGYRRSERLGGACFWIRLPARAQKPARAEESQIAAHPTRSARSA